MNKVVSRIQQIILENPLVQKLLRRPVGYLFHSVLIQKTGNFADVTWMGKPIWQNVLDLWNTQEVISRVKPELIIECGTNRGGSALFYADQLGLLGIDGKVVSIDVEKLHDYTHPKVEFLIGSSISDEIVDSVAKMVADCKGPVMVILDSNHDYSHVVAELERYNQFVTKDSYLLVQDSCIDTVPHFRSSRPGPLPAAREFMCGNRDFVLDRELCERFVITHHPDGWLRRVK